MPAFASPKGGLQKSAVSLAPVLAGANREQCRRHSHPVTPVTPLQRYENTGISKHTRGACWGSWGNCGGPPLGTRPNSGQRKTCPRNIHGIKRINRKDQNGINNSLITQSARQR